MIQLKFVEINHFLKPSSNGKNLQRVLFWFGQENKISLIFEYYSSFINKELLYVYRVKKLISFKNQLVHIEVNPQKSNIKHFLNFVFKDFYSNIFILTNTPTVYFFMKFGIKKNNNNSLGPTKKFLGPCLHYVISKEVKKILNFNFSELLFLS